MPTHCIKAHVLFWFPHDNKLHYYCFDDSEQIDLNELSASADNLSVINLIAIFEANSPYFGESKDTRLEPAVQKQECEKHPVLGSSELFNPDKGIDMRIKEPTNLLDRDYRFPTILPGTEAHPQHQNTPFPWKAS